MDWDMKMHPWDMAELDRDADPSLGSLVRPSTSLGHHTSPSDCSVDLKLGGLGDFGFSGKWKDQNSFSMTMVTSSSSSAMASPSGSSKRTRAVSNGIQNASCLVDGCKSDLSSCREYHRRHKVCEVHSKTPVVTVNGQAQRFCQQCSRFHLLVEFDEAKRSCRKRLDGHNRRRRKPQPDPLNAGSLFVSHQGPRFSTYSQIFPTTTEPHWATVVKTEEDALFGHNLSSRLIERPEHFTGSSSHGYKEAKQFPFLQESDSTYGNRAIETSVHPLLSTMASSESSNRKMYSNGLTQVPESDCALSLLSSPSQTSGINLGHMLSADRIPMGQPLVSSLQQYGALSRYSRSHALNNVSPTGFSCSGMDDAEVGTVMVSDPSDAGLQYQGIFHVGADGTSNETSQAIPFSW